VVVFFTSFNLFYVFEIGKPKISNTTYKEWAFTDYDEDGNLINLPKEGVLTVVSACRLPLYWTACN